MTNDLTVLQNIFFDNSVDGKVPVYLSGLNEKISCFDKSIVFMEKNKLIELKAIAQTFPNHHYSSNTSISKVKLKISSVIGVINIKVVFVDGIGAETLEIDENISCSQSYISKNISLKKESGYFYLKISSLSDNSSVESVQWCTEDRIPEHKVLIGITTFKREEALHHNLNKIVNSDLLRTLNLDLMVVDNGNSVDFSQYDYPIIHTVQGNSGGTGGFMRSLKYAKDNSYSHNMFMDDDIELEPEMLYRAVIFSLFSSKNMTVGLMMMKKSTPYTVWEQGAFINRNKIYNGFSFNYCLDANTEESLKNLNKNRASDFAGWWGCVVPTRLAPMLPYMFIKGDDVLSGLILTESGVPCITLPSAMVWHEDFDKKPYTWQHFYDIRNAFQLRHHINKKTNKKSMVTSFAKLFFGCLLLGDYYRCELMLKAFKHGILPADKYYSDIGKLKNLHVEVMKHFPMMDVSGEVSSITHKGSLKKGAVLSLLTLFGTLNPMSSSSCADGRCLSIPLNSYNFANSYKHKSVVFYDPYTYKGYKCTKSLSKVVKLLAGFGKTTLSYLSSNKNDNQKFVVSEDYWNEEFSEVNRKTF